MINAAQLLANNPELEEEHHIVERLIQRALLNCPDTVWTDPIQRDFAVELLACHYLATKLFQTGEIAAMAQSLNAGQAGMKPQPAMATNDLSSTTYGLQYLELQNALGLTGFIF